MGFIIEVDANDIAAATEPQGSCPPKDTYYAEITEFPDPEWKPGYQGIGRELANKVSFRLLDYDWEYPITGFYTWVREGKDGKQHYTFLNPDSKSNALYTACFGEIPHTGTKVVGDAFLGKRMKIAIEPNAKGYPNITMILPLSARDEAKVGVAPTPAAAAPDAAAPAGGPSRRTLRQIEKAGQEKGYDEDMLNTLCNDEFGVPYYTELNADELDEFLQIVKDADPIDF